VPTVSRAPELTVFAGSIASDSVRELARSDRRVRCLQRIERRGLASACIEGMLASSSPYLAIMDGDLQHDELLLPQMLQALRSSDLDIVVGSRYVAGGTVGDFDPTRAGMSRFATRLSRTVVPANLTDPMSGFFMLRREVFTAANRRLSAIGFKLLVDLFASSPRSLRFLEPDTDCGLVRTFEAAASMAVAVCAMGRCQSTARDRP
jgi:dolichol-phosphate mannosyltransferase